MKKRFVLLVSSLFLVVALFTGCGSDSGKEAVAPGNTNVDTSLPEEIQAIQQRGTINVGVKIDVPKFGYEDPISGKTEGFEIDIAKSIAKKILGDSYADEKVKFTGVTAKTRGPLLDNGDVDFLVSTFTITEERKLSYNFTRPYFVDGVGLLVKKASGINSLADLDGKNIGVAQSATSKAAIQEQADKLGIKVNFLEYASYPEIKTALDSGRVDCFSVDGSILFGYLDDSTVILEDRFSPQEYGIATKLTNKGLAQYLDETVQSMQDSGELKTLMEKWGLE